MDIERAFKVVESEFNVCFIESSVISESLGHVDFDTSTITVFPAGKSLELRRYAFAYFIGHVVLGHSKYIKSGVCFESHVDFQLRANVVQSAGGSLEWQARTFASALLMPRQELLSYMIHLQEQLDFKNRGFGAIYLDDQPCNRLLFGQIMTQIRIFFEAPKPLVSFRVKALDLLIDARRPTRVTGEQFMGVLVG